MSATPQLPGPTLLAPSGVAKAPGHPVALALVSLYLIWGSTYLAIRIAVATLPPFLMAGTRFIVAGAVLLAMVRLRARGGIDDTGATRPGGWPTARQWALSVPIGGLLFMIGNGLVVVAEKTLPSSVAAVVCSTMPLLASAMASVGGERPTAREAGGMLLGVAGVFLLVGGAHLGSGGALGFVVLLAPVGWALGSTIAKRTGATGFAAAGAQMIVGGLWMLVASAVVGEALPATLSLRAGLAWVYLVVFGSVVAFSAYVYLLRTARPALAFSYAYVNPIVAVVLGAVIGGESIGRSTVIATALIVAGVMASAIPRRGTRG